MQYYLPLRVRVAVLDITDNDPLLTIHAYLPTSLSLTLVIVIILVSPVVDDPLIDLSLWVHENVTLEDSDEVHIRFTAEFTATD